MKYLFLILLYINSYANINKEIKYINSQINKVKYVHDIKDVWKTPKEFIKNGGDCEDYAIAKYLYLEKRYDLKLVYYIIIIDKERVPHMVVLLDNKYILDSLSNDILELNDRSDIIVKYSFDRYKIYLNGKVYKNNLKKWNELLKQI